MPTTELKALPATKSRPQWGYRLTRTWDAAVTWDAELEIETTTGVRVRRTTVDRYLVEEIPAIGFTGRAFLLLKADGGHQETKAGQLSAERSGNVYECHIHRSGSWRCTCDAGAVGHHRCCHEIALRDVVVSGGWENPLEG